MKKRMCMFVCIMLFLIALSGCISEDDTPLTSAPTTAASTTTPTLSPPSTQPPTTSVPTTMSATTGAVNPSPNVSLFEEIYSYDFIVNPQTLKANFKIVVNDMMFSTDYSSGYELAIAMMNSFDIRKNCNIYDLLVYDYDITPSHKAEFNFILIGGPIANDLSWQLMQMGYTTYDEWIDSPGHIQYIESPFWAGNDVIIVAGASGTATNMTTIALANYIRSMEI